MKSVMSMSIRMPRSMAPTISPMPTRCGSSGTLTAPSPPKSLRQRNAVIEHREQVGAVGRLEPHGGGADEVIILERGEAEGQPLPREHTSGIEQRRLERRQRDDPLRDGPVAEQTERRQLRELARDIAQPGDLALDHTRRERFEVRFAWLVRAGKRDRHARLLRLRPCRRRRAARRGGAPFHRNCGTSAGKSTRHCIRARR